MFIAKVTQLILVAGTAVLYVSGARADEAPAPASAGELDEILVTAQKRSESIQDTPLAISAVGGEELQLRQIGDMESLAPSLPNMNFGKNVGFARIAIRGLGLDATVAGQEARVAYHTDGVYISRPSAQLSTFFDIDRVEVLRGPQGTLYGRNATAGAINVITNDPEQTFGGYGRVIFGNYNLTTAEGAITGPLSEAVSVRLAVTRTDRDGYGENQVTGQEIDNEHTGAMRAKIKIAPSDTFNLVLSADYSKEDDANYVYHFLGEGQPGVPPRAVALGGSSPSDPRDTFANVPQSDDRKFYGYAANMTANLGSVNVTSVTGYRNSYADLKGDHDGTQAAISIIRTFEKATQFSQELRFDGDIGALRWLVGGFYFDENGYGEADFSPVLAFNNLYQSEGLLFNGTFTTKATAAFGKLDYEFASGLKVSAGVRYSREIKSIDQRGQIDLTTPATPNFTPNYTRFQDQDATFSSTTPNFNIEYKVAPRVSTYATYSKGFKSGGFNLTGFTPPVKPEKLTNYEAGLKSDWLGGRLRVNTSAFYYDYRDLQVQKIVNAAAILVNAATARVKGVELEFAVRPVEKFELSGNASVLDARFTAFSTADASRPTLGTLDLSGNQLPQAPKLTANLAAQYTFDLRSGELALRGEAVYTSRVYFSPFDRLEVSQAAYTKENVLLTYSRQNGLTSSLWVRNVTDRRTISSAQISSGFLGFPIMGTFDAPRTLGVSIGYRF